MLVLAEPLALPPHLLEQPEADVRGGELRVDGGLLQPLRVQVLRRPVAHREPELLLQAVPVVVTLIHLRLLPRRILAAAVAVITLLLSANHAQHKHNKSDGSGAETSNQAEANESKQATRSYSPWSPCEVRREREARVSSEPAGDAAADAEAARKGEDRTSGGGGRGRGRGGGIRLGIPFFSFV